MRASTRYWSSSRSSSWGPCCTSRGSSATARRRTNSTRTSTSRLQTSPTWTSPATWRSRRRTSTCPIPSRSWTETGRHEGGRGSAGSGRLHPPDPAARQVDPLDVPRATRARERKEPEPRTTGVVIGDHALHRLSPPQGHPHSFPGFHRARLFGARHVFLGQRLGAPDGQIAHEECHEDFLHVDVVALDLMARQIDFPEIEPRPIRVESIDHSFQARIVIQNEDDLVFLRCFLHAACSAGVGGSPPI